jgi:hypothetical protein
MSQPTEVFKNEEASKLLDYFVAYKKLINKVDYIRCISALCSEIHFQENRPLMETPILADTETVQQPISCPELKK